MTEEFSTEPYEAPTFEEIGTVRSLTQVPTDGSVYGS